MGLDLTGTDDPDRVEPLGDHCFARVHLRGDHNGPITLDADDAGHVTEAGQGLGHPAAGLALEDHRRPVDDRHDVEFQYAVNRVLGLQVASDLGLLTAGTSSLSGSDTEEKLVKRLEYDLYYIENWSVTFDIYILFRTVFAVLFPKNAF